MSIVLLACVGVLVAVGVYLITARSLSRMILGFALLGHATVLALLFSGGPAGDAPITTAGVVDGELADPIPQALSLTAIVISFGLTLFLLALAVRQRILTGDDLVEDDLEDRRVARDRTDDTDDTDDTDTELEAAS